MTYEEYLEKQKQGGGLTGVSQGTQDKLNQYSQGYQQSQAVQDAQNYLQGVLDKKPGDFSSGYDPQIKNLYDQVMNREKFTYDVAKDPLYQQYKNQYAQMGQLAMQDTVGNAAALTGGYGNSWAATAGNQAYQGYLQQLNARVPELYESAYARYAQEGQNLKDNLALAQSLRIQEYSQYRDQVGDWQTDRGAAQNAFDNAYDRDYARWADMLNYYQSQAGQENSDFWTGQQQGLNQRESAFSQSMAMLQSGMMPDEALLSLAGMTAEQARAYLAKLNVGSGSGGKKSSSGAQTGKYPTLTGLSPEENVRVMDAAGLLDDLKAEAQEKGFAPASTRLQQETKKAQNTTLLGNPNAPGIREALQTAAQQAARKTNKPGEYNGYQTVNAGAMEEILKKKFN